MATSGAPPTPQAMCLHHPDALATSFCSSCGQPLCAHCARQSFGTVLCDRCLEARQTPTAPSGVNEEIRVGSAPVGARMLRPLSYADLLDETFDLYKRHFALLVGTYAVVNFPAAFFMNYAAQAIKRVAPGRLPRGPNFASSPEPDLGMVGLFFITLLFALAAAFISHGALTKAIADTYLGRATSIKHCYAFILRRFFPFLATLILSGLISMAGAMLCCVGLFWGSFAASSFVVEGTGAVDAIQRSMDLARGNWLRCFVIFILVIIFVQIAVMIVTLPVQALTGGLTNGGSVSSSGMALISVANSVASCILVPIQLIAGVLLYFDIRVRREGFDLQMLADRLATSAATSV